MKNVFDKQLREIVDEYNGHLSKSTYDDASDILTLQQVKLFQTRCLAAIERVSGRNSIYFQQAMSAIDNKDHEWNNLMRQMGVTQSLLYDIERDYLKTYEEIIHGDLFSDFLEMADHLLDSGYKDAAAVIAGSTLEAHLKQLGKKVGIALEVNDKPKKADALNSELVKFGTYTKLDQKNVTAWLGLRNDAAHGNYSGYNSEQVKLLISCIKDFIARVPA